MEAQQHAHLQTPRLTTLPDDILRRILDLAMIRDSPLYISDPYPFISRPPYARYREILTAPTGATDPSFTGFSGPWDSPQHNRAPQYAHKKDCIAINSTSRRIRHLGKISFFQMKTFAIHHEFITNPKTNTQGTSSSRKRRVLMPGDKDLALLHIRDVIILNARESSPATFISLPKIAKALPQLRRCTLLFQLDVYGGILGSERGPDEQALELEWITAAWILAGPIPVEMRGLMDDIGWPKCVRLEEAMGPVISEKRMTKWRIHEREMEQRIWPTLRMKGDMMRARREREMGVSAALGS